MTVAELIGKLNLYEGSLSVKVGWTGLTFDMDALLFSDSAAVLGMEAAGLARDEQPRLVLLIGKEKG